MVAVLLYLGNIVNTDLGVGKETTAYLGGIQYHLGLDFVYGVGTAPSLIELFRQQLG